MRVIKRRYLPLLSWSLDNKRMVVGGATALQLARQASGGVQIPIEYLQMAPYLATILVLVILRAGRAPGSLGRPFHASS